MGDQYDDMKGPELAAELAQRELGVTGRVDELRDRLREDDQKRAQADADGPDTPDEGDGTEEPEIDVPAPRVPRREQPYGVRLTEEQARVLNAGTASVLHFTKHVNRVAARKYAAGDQVLAIGSPEDTKVLVLPFGVEIELTDPAAEHGQG